MGKNVLELLNINVADKTSNQRPNAFIELCANGI